MRIVVLNPNTSATMTAGIEAAASAAASPGTEIVAVQPRYGPEAIDSASESYLSAVAVMDRMLTLDLSYDAVVLAGFGEHGRDGLAELLPAPVFDIAECAAITAMLIGRTYSVVTTLQRSVAAIQDRLALAGLSQRCASVRACGMGTAELDADPAAAFERIVSEALAAVEQDHAEVICLGCGGMAELANAITQRAGVPVVDGVAAGVRLAEAVVGMGLSTSRACTFAAPEPNVISHWPLSASIPGLS